MNKGEFALKNGFILSGKKSITNFVGRSWETVSKWIDEKEFPAKKLDGVWEADAEMIIDWRKRQLKPVDGE